MLIATSMATGDETNESINFVCSGDRGGSHSLILNGETFY